MTQAVSDAAYCVLDGSPTASLFDHKFPHHNQLIYTIFIQTNSVLFGASSDGLPSLELPQNAGKL